MNATSLRRGPVSVELAHAVADRLVLLVNHVLRGEPVATARLQPHAGRTIEVCVTEWPSLLPPVPRLRLAVTPAGLIERLDTDDGFSPSLRIGVDAADPAGLVAGLVQGRRPRIDLEGDAALAGDVDWLIDHVRWDVLDDVQRLLGPDAAAMAASVAGTLDRVGGGLLRTFGVRARRSAPGD